MGVWVNDIRVKENVSLSPSTQGELTRRDASIDQNRQERMFRDSN